MQFLLDIVKLLKPKTHNTIALLIVVSGLSLISTSLIEKILSGFLQKEFDIRITGENDSVVGLILISLALIYHFLLQKHNEDQAKDSLSNAQTSELTSSSYSLPPNPSLLGRKKELESLNTYLTSSSPVSLIEGFGGVGKTSLAISSAYNQQSANRYQRIIWLSAKGLDLTLFRLIDELISALDQPYIMKLENHKRPLEILKILRSQTILIILDNFESVNENEKGNIFNFLGTIPNPSKTLITSRPPCSSEPFVRNIDINICHLHGLTQHDSMELLKNELLRIGSNYTEQSLLLLHEELHCITEGNPLAIILTVSQLGFGYSLEESIRHLRTAKGNIFQLLFDSAWNALEEDDKRLLIMGSLFAASFRKDSLRLVSEMEQQRFDGSFDKLVKTSLIKSNYGLTDRLLRFELHPLTKVYAETKGRDIQDFTHDANVRLAKYYVRFAKHNEVRFWEGREVYAPLDDERQNISALMDWCWVHNQRGLFVAIAIAMADYLIVKGYWQQCLDYGEKAILAAQQLRKQKEEAWILIHMQGYLFANRAEFTRSEEVLQTAIDILCNIGDTRSLSEARRNLGRVYRKKKDFDKAKGEYLKSRDIAVQADDKALVALVLNEIGKLERDLGKFQNAKKLFEEAIATIQHIDNSIHAGILCNMAGVAIELNEIESARQHSRDSLKYFELIDNQEGIATSKWRLAVIANLTNEAECCRYAKEAYDIFYKLGMKDECEYLEHIITASC